MLSRFTVNSLTTYPLIKMSGCSTSATTEAQNLNNQKALPACSNLSQTTKHFPLQHDDIEEENKQGDDNGNENPNEEEDEDEDVDFNPFMEETNSIEASSSLSSEVEYVDTDVADTGEEPLAALLKSFKEDYADKNAFYIRGNIDPGKEIVARNSVSSGEVCGKESDTTYATTADKESLLIIQADNGSLCDRENGFVRPRDVANSADPTSPMVDIDTEGGICMRTRARYSLASFTLEELETFLQETDDEDDIQNVDDEEEYRKFLAAVLRGDDSQNLQGNVHTDDEDEENDADFELELEEALESEPDDIEEPCATRRNRRQKGSVEHSKKLSGQLNRPLRPILPFASLGSFSAFDGKQFVPNTPQSYIPPVNNAFSAGFTPHQIGLLHCLIHEHVQLLIQVFSICVLEPAKSSVASDVKELILEMLQKQDQVLAWRTLPYPSFCFSPPYVHPSVPGERQKMLPPDGSKKVGSFQSLECTSWVPYICGPVLSVIDVAPLRLVQNYIDDVSSAVRAHERRQIDLGFETHCQKEPLFPLHNSIGAAESDGQGEMENSSRDSSGTHSSSCSSQQPKRTMAATLLEKAKNQSVALVHKEIAILAQRFLPLFNPALYPHKPPPAALANRVLFTDAEDGLLALGLMEYNTDWKAIQQRFLPCKSRHQIFVRQKNRVSSKAPENPIKAVRRMKNSPLTSEEIAHIEMGLKRFKLDWISIWRFFIPYRDPSLLPRQWRIALGTQKSYKSDANKKAKRRLYEIKRKIGKPPIVHSSSEKEGDNTDNVIEETNSGDNRMEKEDEAYVHEAFLADGRADNKFYLDCQTRLPSQESSQVSKRNDNLGSGNNLSQMYSKSPAALRPPSQVVLRPYRARRENGARTVKLAPDLPPVNLPPSVRVMSQLAFKSSHAEASSKIFMNALKPGGMMVENGGRPFKSATNSGTDYPVKSGHICGNPVKDSVSNEHLKCSEILVDKCVVERADSDPQLHPLLFQAPQDGHSPSYPMNCSASDSSSFTFLPGKQTQLSLSLFHNPRHIRDAVTFLTKSSKSAEKIAPSSGGEFHPLLQRTNDVGTDSTAGNTAAWLHSSAESRRSALIQNPYASISKPCIDGNSNASIATNSSLHGNFNELDLDIHLNFTCKNQESVGNRNMIQQITGSSKCGPSRTIETETTKDASKERNPTSDAMSGLAVVSSGDERNGKVSEKIHAQSFPEIIMEQEELSDSEEEFGENIEFEHEEMADSEDSTSESGHFVNMPNELDGTDADIGDCPVINTRGDCGGNTCSTSDVHSFRSEELADEEIKRKANAPSLNLNSCPPVSPHSNAKDVVAGCEFGPFGPTRMLGKNQLPTTSRRSGRYMKPGKGRLQKCTKEAPEHLSPSSRDILLRNPKKRACEFS